MSSPGGGNLRETPLFWAVHGVSQPASGMMGTVGSPFPREETGLIWTK